MTVFRYLAVGLSAGLLAFVGVLLVSPELLNQTPAAEAIRHLDTLADRPDLVFSAVGALLLGLVGFLVLMAPGSLRIGAATTPTGTEERLTGVSSVTAGADLDEQLAAIADGPPDERRNLADALRDELRETAVTVLHRTEDWTDETIQRRLETGDWTSDPQAAAFLAGTSPPFFVRLREWLSLETPTELRVERTVQELERRLSSSGLLVDDERTGPETRDSIPTRPDDGHSPASTESDDSKTVSTTVEETDLESTAERGVPVARWNTPLIGGLFAVAVGLLVRMPVPVLLGIVAISYTLPKYLSAAPRPTIEVRRTIEPDRPLPGDAVTVRVTIENIGDRVLPDLRVIDGPPEALAVIDGAPAILTALRPGERDSFSYRLRAKRGEFVFTESQVIARGLGNVRQQSARFSLPARLDCHTLLEEFPLYEQTALRIGTVKTDEGGSGIEFYSTREYRPGDPMRRINWHRLAKADELTTIEFREHRAAVVTLIIDQREAARIAPESTELDGVDLCVYAAERTFRQLIEAGNEVGIIAIDDESLASVDVGAGVAQRARIQTQLRAATDRYAAALGADVIESGEGVQRAASTSPETIQRYLPRNAQIVLLSPAADDFVIETTEHLRAHGFPVIVLSPDIVGAGSTGQRVRRIDRHCHQQALRDTGTRVIDWDPDEPIESAVRRTVTRWL